VCVWGDFYCNSFNFLNWFLTGVIKSFSTRTYRLNEIAYKYTWDQTITFKECEHDPSRSISDSMRLGVTRNFVTLFVFVWFVFTSSCLGSCLIYIICVCLLIVVFNTFLWIVYFWLPLRYSLTFILVNKTWVLLQTTGGKDEPNKHK
jgi:hypothetical protein